MLSVTVRESWQLVGSGLSHIWYSNSAGNSVVLVLEVLSHNLVGLCTTTALHDKNTQWIGYIQSFSRSKEQGV